MTLICCDKSQLPSSHPEAAKRMKRPNGPILIGSGEWKHITIEHPSTLIISGGTLDHVVYAVPEKEEAENTLASGMVYPAVPFTTHDGQRRSLLYLHAPGPWAIRSDGQAVSAAVIDTYDGILPALLKNPPVAGRDASDNIVKEIQSESLSEVQGDASGLFYGLQTIAGVVGVDNNAGTVQVVGARGALTDGDFDLNDPGLFVNAREEKAQRKLTATAAAGAGVTLTLPDPAAVGAYHNICWICITKYAAAAKAGAAAPDIVTTTNLSGLAWDTRTVLAIGELERIIVEPARPIRGDSNAAATTIVCPALASVIWRVSAAWFEN